MSEQETLARRFHEGLCLQASSDHSGAAAKFLECTLVDPGCAEFVEELLAAARRTIAADRAAPPVTEGFDALLQKAASEKNWAEVLRQGPRLLMSHPWHGPTLVTLADACAAEGHREAEACYWKAAVEAAPDDVAIQRRGGRALGRMNSHDAAIDCWHRVEARDPADEEAPRMIASLTIAQSRSQSGLDETQASPSFVTRDRRRPNGVPRVVIGNLDSLVQPATQPGGLSLSPIQQLEAAIRERPSIPELYLKLAQLYLDKDRDYDAERLLAKGRDATDRDARVLRMWEDVTMFRQRRRVAIAQEEVRVADSPASQAALAHAFKERDRVELEICQSRVKRDGDSAAAHYELGLQLARAEKLREACRHFEKALTDAAWRGPAALELARSLEKMGDVPPALAHYRLAASSATADQIEEKKDSLYRAGNLAVRIKLIRLAQRYLAELLRIDPSHRDAAKLMQGT